MSEWFIRYTLYVLDAAFSVIVAIELYRGWPIIRGLAAEVYSCVVASH